MFSAVRNEQYSKVGHQYNINRCLQNVFSAVSIHLSREKSRMEMVHNFLFLNFDKCAIFKIEHKEAQVSLKKKSCQHGGKQIWICELLLNFNFCNLWLLSSFWLLLLERQATGRIFLFACFLNRKIKAPFFENGTTFQHRFDLHSLSLFFALLYNGNLSWLIDT